MANVYISVFEMLKIGIGPSSSHTLGPWKASGRFISHLKNTGEFAKVQRVRAFLYGSLSLTGKGHSTDVALMLGLSGKDVENLDPLEIEPLVQEVRASGYLNLNGEHKIAFDHSEDIIFLPDFLPFHSNALKLEATLLNGAQVSQIYYSIGGGFVVQENEAQESGKKAAGKPFLYELTKGGELLEACRIQGKNISDIAMENELCLKTTAEIEARLAKIWDVMLESLYLGCHKTGILPGGLGVVRRAGLMHPKLAQGRLAYNNKEEWVEAVRALAENDFEATLNWVNVFALAVNEVNASLGRVVTAPTNGSAGVIPAVLAYYLCFVNRGAGPAEIRRFLLTAGVVGGIFKHGSTISAAAGGCQAEIGVSSAMAAAALTELHGGSPEQALVAAEVAMEHHLGLVCDPVAGLVQIPCIERNTMGAIKAINACSLALKTNPGSAIVSLDTVVKVMWEISQDMHVKYKETSLGGLATSVPVSLPEC